MVSKIVTIRQISEKPFISRAFRASMRDTFDPNNAIRFWGLDSKGFLTENLHIDRL